jgi:hypothetical protein
MPICGKSLSEQDFNCSLQIEPTVKSVMADSDDDSADISNALLLEDAKDGREAMPSSKRRKLSTKEEEPFDNLDVFLHETAGKAKLSGSSFKNMGLTSSICILLTARLWTYTAEIYCTKGIQKPNADSTENNSSNHGRSRCCRNGTNRVRQNSIICPPHDRETQSSFCQGISLLKIF